MLSKMLLPAGVATLAFLIFKLSQYLLQLYFSPLRDLPGPPVSSWIFGNFKEIWRAENSVMHEKWVEEYGSTYKYRVFLGVTRLLTFDTRAIHHILNRSDVYHKPDESRHNLGRILGSGLLVVEDDEHKKQRRIMNPAFGPAHIREMTPIFLEKSIQLRDVWNSVLSQSETPDAKVDAVPWLSKLTLDIIGLSGFNYQFHSLDVSGKPNELNQAFSDLFRASTQVDFLALLATISTWFSVLDFIPTKRNMRIKKARRTMDKIGRELLAQMKAALIAESHSEKIEKAAVESRDLLSLLVRANMASDLPDNQRLSDEDVLAQVPTFLTAGHETTSTATTWCLYALSLNPAAQDTLREELLSVPTETPSMDELAALPYLDAVCRETLRVHAPVPSTTRVAVKDDIIPLNKPFVDRHGCTRDSIRISKGDTIFIPILAMNRSQELWGEDAHEFRPERWKSPPAGISNIPGVWGNVLTFLGGSHACIGYRFSVIEMKAILFTLIRAFEFGLAVPKERINKRALVVQRPIIIEGTEKKTMMPLIIRQCTHD